jgi:hypothetical protein
MDILREWCGRNDCSAVVILLVWVRWFARPGGNELVTGGWAGCAAKE